MALFKVTYYSRLLGRNTEFSAAISEKLTEDVPWVLILHGLGGNGDDWLRYGNAEQLARENKLAIVTVSAERSFYADQYYGSPYYSFICEELIPYLFSIFPLSKDPKKRFIMGESMGGYGSLKIALNHPQDYAGVAAFSGVADIWERFDPEGPRAGDATLQQAILSWGPDYPAALHRPEENPMEQLKVLVAEKAALPAFFLLCGTEDKLYPANDRLHTYLTEQAIPHEWHAVPGAHNWTVWRTHAEKAFRFFASLLPQEEVQ